MKILLVEDETTIADFVRQGLEEEGWAVDHTRDGDEGLLLALEQPYDAVILDVMLPGRDGLSILRQLRKRDNPVPVVILTARGEVSERVEGLQLGADDYLAKPFYMSELVARLQSVFRRSAGQGLSRLRAHDLLVDLMTRQVWRDGDEIELSNREFNLLVHLMRAPGRVFSRTQILEQVWEYHFNPGTNLVDSCVRRLREKLGDATGRQLVETVRGVGYRLAPET